MGRYYHGTIAGKFVCGVQSSYDPSLFKDPKLYEIPNQYYLYYVCKCLMENNNNLFCNQCYSNYEDHYEDIDDSDKQDINNRIYENDDDDENQDDENQDDDDNNDDDENQDDENQDDENQDDENDNDDENQDDENDDENDNKLLAYPSGYIKYQFDTSDLIYLEQQLNEIESEIGYDIVSNLDFTINEKETCEFEYNLDDNNSEELSDEVEKLVFAWCIGKQIKKAIEVVGECDIFCEI